MTRERNKKRFFAQHAKSSAVLISFGLHALLIVTAASFVAVTVIQKKDQRFVARKISRPRLQLRKLQVPVKIKKSTPRPKLRKRITVQNMRRNMPEVKMPEITGVKGGIGGTSGLGSGDTIGFTMPEIDFFGAKAKGEKVCFVVQLGPDTVGETPYERMTSYAIQKRLEDLVNGLPEYTLFNVACYWMSDTWALSPKMMSATPDNKQRMKDWLAPVNPLEGDYRHCFSGGNVLLLDEAKRNYPQKVEDMPFYAPKWVYPYSVSQEAIMKYVGDPKKAYVHWTRGVAWAILEQKPDTIFVLTTIYVDAWGGFALGEPAKVLASYKRMFKDVYGPDKERWPTINVVLLKYLGDPGEVLNKYFGPIWKGTKGDGSIIDDITEYMTDEEAALYRKYRSLYSSKSAK